VVSGVAVRSEKNKVFKLPVLERDAPKDFVLETRLSRPRHTKAKYKGDTRRAATFQLRDRQGAARAIVFPRPKLGFGAGALRLKILDGAKAGVGRASLLEVPSHRLVMLDALGLK